MKYILVIFFVTFFSFSTTAQNEKDSLYALWKDVNIPDTLRIEAYDTYIRESYYYTKPDSAILLRNELISFIKEKKYEKYLASSLASNGYVYFRTGKYKEALNNYNEALEIAKRRNDSLQIGDILLQFGFLFHDNEDFIKAMDYYEQGLDIFEKAKDTFGISAVYNELGLLHRQQGDFEKSLDYLSKSIALGSTINVQDESASQYTNIGLLYLDMEEYDKALESFQKSLRTYRKTSDQLGIAASLNGIGRVYGKQKMTSKSLDFLQQSLAKDRSVNNVLGISTTLLDLSEQYFEQNMYDKAISACEESLILAKNLGDLGNQKSASNCLYKAYRATNNVDKALIFYEQSQAFSDSINDKQMSTKLQQMEFAKQVLQDSLLQVERDLEVEMEHQKEVRKKDKNRNIAIAVGILFSLLAIGFYSRWRYVFKSRAIIKKEKDRSESLLLNILPAEIAEELKEKGEAAARDFDMVSILFTDFKGFTEKSAKIAASDLIGEINHCFKAFDHICEKYGIEKIKTIGDAYMAAGGLPTPSEDSVKNTVLAGLEMQSFMTNHIEEKKARNEFTFEMRLGIHTGPVVAGIVGVKKFQYDIWGDTVNTASRIESNGSVGKVNISNTTYELLKNHHEFDFEHRGKIEAKGKGAIDMWFVTSKEN